MHITSISQPRGHVADGLGDISMQRLRRIVLIAGANGSGKSRLLNRIRSLSVHDPSANGVQVDGADGLTRLATNVVDFVSKELALPDPGRQSLDKIATNANSATKPGSGHWSKATLPYIQDLQDRWWNVSHQDSTVSADVRDEILDQYHALQTLTEVMLGADLTRNSISGRASLFGMPVAHANLSDGQRALLQWCVGLHAQGLQLKDLILLMDEPENHLHAESLLATIDHIFERNSNGQVWIATHSVPLIAALHAKHGSNLSTYFMSKGASSFAGDRPEQILRSLIGGEENIEALREFVDLPEVFATNRFAAESLDIPEVVAAARKDDPQTSIVDSTSMRPKDCNKILDYGCGKGRLLSSLLALHGPTLSAKLDYVGWDMSACNKGMFEQAIETVYGTSEGRWYCERQEILAEHQAGSFDTVILCNVLHEISPTDWVKIFSSTSLISQLLANTGRVLIIEDYLMPKGEYAHPFGFIVLDTEALQKLFVTTKDSPSITVRRERDGRIKGHVVPKSLICNVTSDSVKQALLFAQRNAREQLEKIRAEGKSDFKSGRAHGFWTQQFANTTLALD